MMISHLFHLAQAGSMDPAPTRASLLGDIKALEATHLDCIQVSGPGHRYVLGALGPPYYISLMVPPDCCFHRISRLLWGPM